MTPHYADDTVTLYAGDCLDVLAELSGGSVDAVVTDPPYELSFMGRHWDASGIAFRPDVWAECLRVLKPGGHLLAFGGTRTWHRLVCAIEDAGFEIRDSIAWLYGSGFPKSLDVSKAIDKARDDRADVLAVTSRLAELAAVAGISRADIDAHMGTSDMGGWWLSTIAHRCACPSVENWTRLRDYIPGATELDAEVWRLNGRKGSPGEAWDKREKVGEKSAGIAVPGEGPRYTVGGSRSVIVDVTAPATPDAQRWQGWGTALKPAHEPVVVGRKPLGLQGVLDTIGSHLDILEAAWQAPEAVPTTRTGGEDDSPAQTDTLPSELETTTNWNTVKSWRACWVELCDLTNTSTTATTSRTTTDLRTLSSLLSKLTPENMHLNGTSQHGLTWIASAVDNLFVSVVCGLRATHALSVTEPAMSPTPTRRQDAAEPSAAFEPIVVARKPLAGTVAQNVLTHGTGALNIDGCRIGTDVRTFGGPEPERDKSQSIGAFAGDRAEVTVAGRWPANVVLDESQAAELDRQSGITSSPAPYVQATQERGEVYGLGSLNDKAGKLSTHHGDSGGASRFFPTFRYEPKAPTTERPNYFGPSCECEDSWPTITSPARDTTATTEPASSSTSKSGNGTTASQSPKGSKSTTLTATSSTTTRPISSRSHRLSTNGSTPVANDAATNGSSPAQSAASSNPSQSSIGTSAPRGGRSTVAAVPATSPRWSATSVCGVCGAPSRREAHATVKPLDLMRWLVRLVTPPGGTVLDPFAGSGTTAEACVIENFSCITIEREETYLPLIVQRLNKPIQTTLI